MQIMSGHPPGIIDPPNHCPYCKKGRAGIQEGSVVFYCGTAGIMDVLTNKLIIVRSPFCKESTDS